MSNTEDEIIETSVDMDWVTSLEKKVSDTKFTDRNTEPTIYRVPDILRKVDHEAYEPSIVSLGPYHRDKPHLKAMNQLKWKYLKSVLQQNRSMALKDYVDLIKKLEKRARAAYSEEVKMSSNSFAEMMLLDGCFVMLTVIGRDYLEESWAANVVVRDIFKLENQLPFFLLEKLYEYAFPRGFPFRKLTFEFIRKYFSSNSSILGLLSDNETFHHKIHLCLSWIDPIKNNDNGNSNGDQSSTFGFLCNYNLVKTVFVSWPSKLRSFLLPQVNKIRTGRDANPEEDLNGNGHDNGNGNQSSTFGFLCNYNLVKTVFVSWSSKLRSSLLSQVNKIRTGRDANPEEYRPCKGKDTEIEKSPVPGLPWIPSATICNEAGIQFKRKQTAKSFLDITFHNGKLEIPQLRIDDDTNMLFRNLIAYEQCSNDSKLHVTSYMVLMDHLIDTAADVQLLLQHEIIISDLGDSQEIATLFNKLNTNVCYSSRGFYLLTVLTAMRKHLDTRCNKWRARLNRDYFSNPWAAISLFGALALFLLTVIQTTFTILGYFRPPK
ncbi:UPF0481 protein At3g47200-like [Zingiber officinale]|uniref:UPF0481 protein At3g47200-like n=1 Tax=Zingiber officinale TaxID=94328 RepID=UPI001C4AE7F6|nr:UPF0481 protein At3g47200-like [Zingiber officinale]